MKIKIIDNWEVELTNDWGDRITLKGEWYPDFFKKYENKKLIIAKDIPTKDGYSPYKSEINGNWFIKRTKDQRVIASFVEKEHLIIFLNALQPSDLRN